MSSLLLLLLFFLLSSLKLLSRTSKTIFYAASTSKLSSAVRKLYKLKIQYRETNKVKMIKGRSIFIFPWVTVKLLLEPGKHLVWKIHLYGYCSTTNLLYMYFMCSRVGQ
jgi:hypothetical protein